MDRKGKVSRFELVRGYLYSSSFDWDDSALSVCIHLKSGGIVFRKLELAKGSGGIGLVYPVWINNRLKPLAASAAWTSSLSNVCIRPVNFVVPTVANTIDPAIFLLIFGERAWDTESDFGQVLDLPSRKLLSVQLE